MTYQGTNLGKIEIIEEVIDVKTTGADAIDASEVDELETMGKELAQKVGGTFCLQL